VFHVEKGWKEIACLKNALTPQQHNLGKSGVNFSNMFTQSFDAHKSQKRKNLDK